MENKKLFTILYNDIVEVEELFTEKKATGFDNLETEFINSRLSGAKHIIQLLKEREETDTKANTEIEIEIETEDVTTTETTITQETKEETVTNIETETVTEIPPTPYVNSEKDAENQMTKEVEPEVKIATEKKAETSAKEVTVEVPETELEEKTDNNEANNRLGDSFKKEKSVNDLLGNKEEAKLEYRISNSPIESLKKSIGINDRYLYIRELFNGNADSFNQTVTNLDNFGNIQQAVEYLQQNFKWKKNETSLKFVTLIKRRFPNE